VRGRAGTDRIIGAFWRLGTPQPRAVDALFWLWPDGDHHEIVAALGRADGPGALRAAQDALGRAPDWAEAAATHNLAVTAHLVALDTEEGRHTATGDGAGTPAAEAWTRALETWLAVARDDECRVAFQSIIRSMRDPRLPIRAAGQLWPRLPAAVLGINGTLLAAAAIDGDEAAVDRHHRLIRGSGYPDEAVDDVLRRSATAIAKALRDAGERAGVAARHKPAEADRIADDLIARCALPLRALDGILPARDPATGDAHEHVALAVVRCCTSLEHGGRAHGRTCELLTTAHRLAPEGPVRQRVARQLETRGCAPPATTP
jgi:hypothetical protein